MKRNEMSLPPDELVSHDPDDSMSCVIDGGEVLGHRIGLSQVVDMTYGS